MACGFCHFGAPVWATGRETPQGAVIGGSPTPVRSALPFGRGWRFNYRNQRQPPCKPPRTKRQFLPPVEYGQAQEALESHAVHLDHFYALFDAIDRLDGDRPLINSLAIIGTKLATHYSIITVPPIESVEAAQVGLRTFAKGRNRKP